jgi:hypothetical protein
MQNYVHIAYNDYDINADKYISTQLIVMVYFIVTLD